MAGFSDYLPQTRMVWVGSLIDVTTVLTDMKEDTLHVGSISGSSPPPIKKGGVR